MYKLPHFTFPEKRIYKIDFFYQTYKNLLLQSVYLKVIQNYIIKYPIRCFRISFAVKI
ncbi:hypothetical protein LEP1GSC082_3047 [Leptospira kirschneri str. H2]|uniref:Uncharacterized protein n=1 Tax=Leptospira kirschneri str. H1 TaxID=1049966 RepID=A0A0E2B140_9LEPT|nr:hypothetical protein LEP1GSC081_1403 [Leptospira kirschneri str. H1]EKO59562.1 hypothetical protein LEP1GSC082_3047 [Leptospira kirschneri str. H2]EMJ89519.1 hypothetical protein LEP1GSC198_2949 [Leptospira kirschneri str. JB]